MGAQGFRPSGNWGRLDGCAGNTGADSGNVGFVTSTLSIGADEHPRTLVSSTTSTSCGTWSGSRPAGVGGRT